MMLKRAPATPARIAGLLLLTLAASAGSQEEDFQQKSTALLNWFPDEGEVVKRAAALAAAGKYVEALAIYDEALEKKPNTVLSADATKTVNTGIREYILGQIASWPEEGKAAYRRRADPLAEHAFQGAKRARDVDALERLVDQFPFSSVVDDALALIANFQLDAGECAAAADALSRLLDREGTADRAVIVARLGLAWTCAGRRKELEDLTKRVERDLPAAEVQVGERRVGLVQHLKGLASQVREGAQDAAPLALPAWEMIGGGPAGTRLAETGVELAKVAWSDVVGLPRLDGEEELIVRRSMALAPTAEYRPLFPAVSDGILYVHNGLVLTAYNFYAKAPEKLWQFRVPTPSGEVMFDNRVIFAPMVHDGRVYANLIAAVGGEENQLGYVRVKFPFPRRALYALDAYTGKLLWKVGGKLASDTLEENASFATAPVAEGGRLYVGAVKQKLSTDPFQHYVMCLDPATGRTLWSTYVASGGTEINLFGNSTRESLGSPVAVGDDAVFYCTNHGAIAALDKKSGRIRWTRRYRQLQVMPTRSVYVQKNRLEWVNSPPVVARGIVVVTPTDSQSLYALDAQTGQLRWDRLRGQDLRTLYGVRDGTLVLGGERVELCDLLTGRPTSPPMADELRGSGRGVIADDGIYVPGQDKLRRLNWDGSWDESSARRWPGGVQDGGNLLIVDGAVVLAAQDSLQVFFDRHDQERTILEALEKHPDDPAVLYRGALRYLQSGDADHAATLLQRTVARTARSSRPEDESLQRAARKRLFAVSMEAGRVELEAGQSAKAVEHFAAARSCAADLSAHVEASVQLARVRLARREDAEAIGEYQRLLLEHGEESVEGGRIFELARNAIGAILAAVGRDAYLAHEKAAGALLDQARRTRTADALLTVFRSYPNSRAGEEALFEAASAHAQLERLDDQIATLRQFLRECSESPRVPEAHARLVRALEKKGHTASAGTYLRRMVRLFPEAPIEDNGGTIPAREFAERRLKTELYARSPGGMPVSTLSPPLSPWMTFTEKDFPEGVPLATLGPPPAGLKDVILMHYASPSSAAVKAIEKARGGTDGTALWTLPLEAPVRFASFLENSLIVADDKTVTRLDPRTGVAEWTYRSPSRMRGHALAGPLLLFITDEGESRLSALEAGHGAVAWSQSFEGVASSRIHGSGESVVFTTLNPNRIQVFEVETGKRLVGQAPFPDGATAQVVYVGDDVLVLHSEGRFLEAYDLPSGKLRWRQVRYRISTRDLKVGPDGLVFLGTRRPAGAEDERLFLETINLRTGKIVRQKESADLGNALSLMVDAEQAVVVSREPDKSVTVRGVSLADFSVLWTTPLGATEATLLPPSLTRNHLVIAAFLENQKDVKYATEAWLLDKSGRVVQNIISQYVYERPPAFLGVAHDRLIVSVNSRVEVYR
ncbi:MAG TPA: PQQ-binding-like beta-propeller repeat protein [Planctomycetota bacterium]|nr:PQQ-binding-like beta-propeller repeat protein [Planctomycetota bacterium]